MKKRYKLIIIHPGIQHSYRLANAAVESNLFSKVYLFTSILIKPNAFGARIVFFKKRVKPVHKEVKLVNFPVYTLVSILIRNLYNKIVRNPNKQVHNNPIYFFQRVYNWLCLPYIYYHRKHSFLVLYETAGWPLTRFAKKWNIPVIMDFPSISHEAAKQLSINETDLGIHLKTKERSSIHYAFFCSKFCRGTFRGLTSSKKDFTLYLGADTSFLQKKNTFIRQQTIRISFIANLEFRKGLDLLLEALYSYSYSCKIELLLVGKIRPEWVKKHMPVAPENKKIKLTYVTAMPQTELFQFLKENRIDLNMQPSRFDSFAMVVPETMMQGIPNVVSPYVGSGELLEDGVDGFIMDDMSAESIVNILQRYMAMETTAIAALRHNVLKKASSMSWEQYNKQVASAFASILSR